MLAIARLNVKILFFNLAITSQLAQIIYKMQSEMAAFSVCIDIYIEKTNGFIK